MKKLFTLIFVLSFVMMPAVTHAGFFDFLRGGNNQSAQVRTSVSATVDSGTYVEGDRNDIIQRVQAVLKSKNLYGGAVSGTFGPRTRASITAYQRANGLSATGMLDVPTLNFILGRSSDSRGGGNPTPTALCNSNTAPWVKVLSPNGGESFEAGQSIPIQWETCNAPAGSTVGVVLIKNTTETGAWTENPINSSGSQTDNDGTDSITFPYGLNIYGFAPDDDFKVGIQLANSSDPLSFTSIYDHSDNFFSIVDGLVGGGNCEEDEVDLSILPTTPFGVQTNTDDFPALEFKIENPTNCDVQLDNMQFIYMVTDTLPYFEDLTLREKDTMINVGTGEANTGISGEFLELSFGQNGYLIDAGDEQDFLLVLEVYNQPTQGQLPYNEFINKSMIFGLPKLNSLNFRFTTDMFPHTLQLPVNIWGKVVQLPL